MMKKVALLGSVALMALGATPASAQFKAALNTAEQTVADGAKSQQRVEDLDDQASALLGEYRAKVKELELLQRYNVSRERQVQNQLDDIAGYRQDLENVEGVKRAVTPLMEEMIVQLERVIEADTPFLMGDRTARLNRLKAVMEDSSQNEASRYGLILEAFQIELDYGRSLGVYSDTVDVDGEELAVDFLRIGRLALIYKTPDDAILRIYNTSTGQFEDLDKSFLAEVRRTMRIADGKAAPDLLTIPVTAPVDMTAGQ